MWNLNGNDIQRAKEELKGRRAAIQARYENELKQLEVDIADLETFERFAVKFVTDFKNEEAAAMPAAESAATPSDSAGEAASAIDDTIAAAASAEPEAAVAGPELTTSQKNSSRWRMRLNTGEAAP